MASTITAGNATNGLAVSADNTGALDIKTGSGAGTTAISIDSSQVVTLNGGVQRPLLSGTAQNSTSGTSIDFTNIPSWVKRITVMFNGVSTTGTSIIIVQLGTGATPTYTTTGYNSYGTQFTATTIGASSNQTTGFNTTGSHSAANTYLGNLTLTTLGNNIWTGTGQFWYDSTHQSISAGGVSLAALLTGVRITTVNGTDTFDAGSINILYE